MEEGLDGDVLMIRETSVNHDPGGRSDGSGDRVDQRQQGHDHHG